MNVNIYIYIYTHIFICIYVKRKIEKQGNPKRRIKCKRKSCYNVSVLVNHHQNLERMIFRNVRSPIDF